MSRVSVTDQAKLSLFLARAILRTLLGQFVAFWIYRLPLFSGKNDRLVIAPQDLRTADATQAAEIHSGRFVFAGKVVVCDGRSPFEISPPSEEWAIGLHGFSWLRHLRTSDPAISRVRARSLVNEWTQARSAPATRSPAARGHFTPHHLVADASPAAGRRFRCPLLSPFHSQPEPPGAGAAHNAGWTARWSAAPAGRDRSGLCIALHAGSGALYRGLDQAAGRRA